MKWQQKELQKKMAAAKVHVQTRAEVAARPQKKQGKAGNKDYG